MTHDVYDKIMMLAKRRGFIYPSFEIYGGAAGFYDYGPLGSQLKENVENLWRRFYVIQENCFELTTPTITLYDVLKASGHVDEFTDLTMDCPQCSRSYKVEDLLDETSSVKEAVDKGTVKCPTCGSHLKNPHEVNLMFSTSIGAGKGRKAFLRPETAQGIFIDFHLLYRHAREKLPFGVVQLGKGYRNEVSPRQGIIRLREFFMAEAEIFFDPQDKSHPRFDEVRDKQLHIVDQQHDETMTLGEAVNNTIINNEALAYYMGLTQDFLLSVGVNPEKCRFRKHGPDEMAHYATECWDAELYSERFGWIECVGIADRSAYDLRSHTKSSEADMYAMRKYDEPRTVETVTVEPKMDVLGPMFKDKAGKIKAALEKMGPKELKEAEKVTVEVDGEHVEIPSDAYEIRRTEEKQTGEKFIPHVIEPSYGVDRILYCVLEHNYEETTKEGEEYHLLKLKSSVAPIKAGVFPLVGNDQRLVSLAEKIDLALRKEGIQTFYDDGGSIGRRYARMDEIGTPFCITVDHDSLEDNMVTVRDRDTTEQTRENIDDLARIIKERIC